MKFLKGLLIVVIVLVLLGVFVGKPYMQKQTKKHSPERTATYTKNGMDLSVNYSSPSKKGRTIFGELVPFDAIWRTGANEPTTFTTNSKITVMGESLPAGTYSLWTKPNPEQWTVMFNKEVPDWGVTLLSGGKDTTRDPEQDAVEVTASVMPLTQEVEQFTISFADAGGTQMCLSWDTTKVCVPIEK
ncbi:DUF2911 domain-containing protein [Aggregatimonas sangjinii]|uniref:DUF2911 domain-containing protein n=1 Tax=Aggregatimonas sangjinii TaxID=2583587 RepID=A0A5B7SUM5_9FLAO|nr:DUF2911 domain-containing protein [Aggregatimonas sangjinii]QCX00748.1 DUF2911 domain-containing protein [Aggregatimonas sangjinii]